MHGARAGRVYFDTRACQQNRRLRPVLCAPGERCGRVPRDGSGSLPAPCFGGASAQDPLYTSRLSSARASAQPIAAVALSRHSATAASNDYGADLAAVGSYPRGTRSTTLAAAVPAHAPCILHLAFLPAQMASAARTSKREQADSGSLHKATRGYSARGNKLIANFR